MPDPKDSQQWSEYLTLFQEVERRLSKTQWFEDGWQSSTGYMMNGGSPSGVAFRLARSEWFEGAIHLESWLSNADLKRGTVPVVLHVETNQEKTGLNKNRFVRLVLDRGADLIGNWDGYIVKEKYAAEPLRRNLSFDKSNLATQLESEFVRLQQLAPIINQAVKELT